ncbi:TetR/AcrR family transcriptional regulator [soil metagenome]
MPRAGLSPDVLVQRATAIIDDQGAAGLTLARLAGELGVSTPSLYKHVDGLEDLLARVAAAATEELAAQLGRAIRGRSGRDGLTALAHAYRDFARAHPGTYALTQGALGSDAGRAAAEDALAAVAAALSGYGVTEHDTHLIRFVRATLHGFADLELGGGFGLPASVDDSFAFAVDALHSALTRKGDHD